jgi:hypothetical protein
MNRSLPFIELRVHEKTDNTLVVGGVESFKLYTLTGDALLKISVKKILLWNYLWLRAKTA